MPMRTYTTILVGSTGIVSVGLGNPNAFIGSSAIGTTSISSTGFQKIEYSNGFAVQLNVGLASSALSPSGTVTLQGSCDGINFNTMPTGYNGSSAVTFSTTGSFMMMNYPQPNFNALRANYIAGSSSAASIYSVILNSKTFS